MPKQTDFLFKGGSEEETVKFSIRLTVPAAEKELFDKYCEVTGGKPSEICRFALQRLIKYDKFFQNVKDDEDYPVKKQAKK